MSNTEPVRVTIRIEVRPTAEEHEIDRAEWDAMTPVQRRALLDGITEDAVSNAGGYGWTIDNPDDEAATEADR